MRRRISEFQRLVGNDASVVPNLLSKGQHSHCPRWVLPEPESPLKMGEDPAGDPRASDDSHPYSLGVQVVELMDSPCST